MLTPRAPPGEFDSEGDLNLAACPETQEVLTSLVGSPVVELKLEVGWANSGLLLYV